MQYCPHHSADKKDLNRSRYLGPTSLQRHIIVQIQRLHDHAHIVITILPRPSTSSPRLIFPSAFNSSLSMRVSPYCIFSTFFCILYTSFHYYSILKLSRKINILSPVFNSFDNNSLLSRMLSSVVEYFFARLHRSSPSFTIYPTIPGWFIRSSFS